LLVIVSLVMESVSTTSGVKVLVWKLHHGIIPRVILDTSSSALCGVGLN